MEEDDKGCPVIRMGVSGWMFLLVPGSPGQKAVKRQCVCVITGVLGWAARSLHFVFSDVCEQPDELMHRLWIMVVHFTITLCLK